jgi:hypothetical protein
VITVRGGIFQTWMGGPNKALIAFTFGDYLSLKRGGHLDTIRAGNLFAISSPGPAVERTTTAADIDFILAAVSGHKTKLAGKTIQVKGRRWPYYYGIQPAGIYPDQPFIRELYYDTVAGDIARSSLRAVPVPQIVATPTPVIVQAPVVVQPEPPPVITPIVPSTGPTIR